LSCFAGGRPLLGRNLGEQQQLSIANTTGTTLAPARGIFGAGQRYSRRGWTSVDVPPKIRALSSSVHASTLAQSIFVKLNPSVNNWRIQLTK